MERESGEKEEVEKGEIYSEIERLRWNVKSEEGEVWTREAGIPQGWVITFKCSSAPPSSPLLFFPPPSSPTVLQEEVWKVIMFPLEMARSPSAPFISKWNNLSTVAFFFFSLHLHLSFQYTTPAPLSPFFLSLTARLFSSSQPSSIWLFNPFLFSFPLPPFFFFFSSGFWCWV